MVGAKPDLVAAADGHVKRQPQPLADARRELGRANIAADALSRKYIAERKFVLPSSFAEALENLIKRMISTGLSFKKRKLTCFASEVEDIV